MDFYVLAMKALVDSFYPENYKNKKIKHKKVYLFQLKIE